MHDMVVQVLHPEHEIPDVGGVLGDFHLDRVFEGAGGGQRVGIGAHFRSVLREVLHVAGVAPDQNRFKAAVQAADAAGFADAPVLHFHFNAQVAFDTGQGIDDDRSGEMAHQTFFLASLMGAPSKPQNGDSLSQKPGSLQPMHGCPAPTGQLVPLNLTFGQLFIVSGPLQPSSHQTPAVAGPSESKEGEFAVVEVFSALALVVHAVAAEHQWAVVGIRAHDVVAAEEGDQRAPRFSGFGGQPPIVDGLDARQREAFVDAHRRSGGG